MPERRRTRTAGGQVKSQRPITQTTLKDLFQKTNSGTAHLGKEEELVSEHVDPVTPSPQTADAHPPALPSRLSQLFPIFTKVSSVRENRPDTVIDVDNTEVIDITDKSPDIELSTEPPLSSSHLPSHSESSQATSHSPPLSPIRLNVPCCSNTSIPHVYTRHHSPADGARKESNKRTLELRDIVPLPSSWSQHVRGVQHSYTCSQALLKRSMFPGFSPSSDEGTDFFMKWRQVGDTPPIPPDRMDGSLTLEQREEYLRSLSRNYAEAHPAFAQISIQQERVSLRHAEMWTRRFRPRRADEVLGNERHALYLRGWLRALELQWEGRKPEEQVSNGATAKEKITKRTDPRGVKRARVVRAVTRKRGNKKRRVDSDDDLDNFVVFNDADEEQADDPLEDSEDELAFCQRTLTRLRRRDTTDGDDPHSLTPDELDTEIQHATSKLREPVQTNFAEKLTNTLLITGPPGCGKTAAVYACAEELGWEVFEVYPGIGRRNGASLDHLVGDVGRNHIVQTVDRRAQTKTTKPEAMACMGLRGYLAKGSGGEFAGFGESQEAGTEARPIDVEGDSPRHGRRPLPPGPEDLSEEAANCGKCHAEPDGSRPIVRQSLVLLEEVDILFKEDAGFWPAVVDLIRCCQRPVVMTCNDPGLVPVADLPLQTVLEFEPCPSTVAATFLQCVSLTEGCLVPREDLMVLYESTHAKYGLNVPDATGYPRTEPIRIPDLRRSITQLQMLCAGARHGSASEMHQGDEAEGHGRRSAGAISAASRVTAMGSTVESEWWRKMKWHSEVMSHVDAELCRAGGDVAGLGEGERGEEGYAVVEERGERETWWRDELIAGEAILGARGVHEDGTGPSLASINPAARLDARVLGARVEYRSRMMEALQEVVGLRAAVMPWGSVFLDYIPWVREMVLVDDDLERSALEGRGGGRWTRNSLRRVHARNVVLGEGPRDELRRSRLAV